MAVEATSKPAWGVRSCWVEGFHSEDSPREREEEEEEGAKKGALVCVLANLESRRHAGRHSL